MDTPKRGRGRPKGSKNKPTAGNVGRPRKDGQPPRKRYLNPGALSGAEREAVAVQGSLPSASSSIPATVGDRTGSLLERPFPNHTPIAPHPEELHLLNVPQKQIPTVKRPVGRPKGSKNGPNVGNVGRPRKDGQPPRKRQRVAEPDIAVPDAGYHIDPSLMSLSHNDVNSVSPYMAQLPSPDIRNQVDSTHSLTPQPDQASGTVVPGSGVTPSGVPVKRGRGRPKGTKNSPNAKNVGRPRKDGRPPQRRSIAATPSAETRDRTDHAGGLSRPEEPRSARLVGSLGVNNSPSGPSQTTGLRWQNINPESYMASLEAPDPVLGPVLDPQLQDSTSAVARADHWLRDPSQAPREGQSSERNHSLPPRVLAPTHAPHLLPQQPASLTPVSSHTHTAQGIEAIPRSSADNAEDWFCVLPASSMSHLPFILSHLSARSPQGRNPWVPDPHVLTNAVQVYTPATASGHLGPSVPSQPKPSYYLIPLRDAMQTQSKPAECSELGAPESAPAPMAPAGSDPAPEKQLRRKHKPHKPRSCMHCKSMECPGRWRFYRCPILMAKKQAALGVVQPAACASPADVNAAATDGGQADEAVASCGTSGGRTTTD